MKRPALPGPWGTVMSENEPENNDRSRGAPTDPPVRETGAAAGVTERRLTASGRRATDPAKVPCPACRGSESCVISTRPARRAEAIRRRRKCAVCLHVFSTLERTDTATSLAPTVVELAHRLQVQAAMGNLPAGGLVELPPADQSRPHGAAGTGSVARDRSTRRRVAGAW